MGHRFCRACELSSSKDAQEEQLVFRPIVPSPRNISTTATNTKYPIENIVTIQKYARKAMANGVVREENKVMSHIFDRIFIGDYTQFVDENEIDARRGRCLTEIETKFKSEHGNFSITECYEGSSSLQFLLSFTKGPVLLKKADNDIYQGSWKWCINNEKANKIHFFRAGIGSLYKSNGDKVEALWNDEQPIKNGRIYLANGKVFMGGIVKGKKGNYVPEGRGTFYIFSNLNEGYSSIISGTWTNGLPHGLCVRTFPNKYTVAANYIDGKIKVSSGTIKYSDSSVYEGEFKIVQKEYLKHGFGKMTYSSGIIYEGLWNSDKYHGKGLLFTPIAEKETSRVVNGTAMMFGNGTYIQSTWVKGLLNGEGTMYTKNNTFSCMYRFGKTIHINEKMKNHKISLHPNIFSFLTPVDLFSFVILGNHDAYTYFKKHNFSNLIKFRLFEIFQGVCGKNKKLHSSKMNTRKSITEFLPIQNQSIVEISDPSPYNQYLVNNIDNFSNVEDILNNFRDEKNILLPLIGYRTTGGVPEKRFHYLNLFNPQISNGYFTNYLLGILSDIEVGGGLNAEMYEEVHGTNGVIQSSVTSPFSIKFLRSLFHPSWEIKAKDKTQQKLYEGKNQMVNNPLQMTNHEDYFHDEQDYLPLYEKYIQEYQFDYVRGRIFDENILSKLQLTNNEQYFFAVNQIIVKVPIKLSLYTVSTNPVRVLAIYISDQEPESLSNTRSPSTSDKRKSTTPLGVRSQYDELTINSSLLRPYEDLNEQTNFDHFVSGLISMKFPVIRVVSNADFRYIEFDSLVQLNMQRKLMCLIFLKNYHSPTVVNLKPYYHTGKYVTIKLVDQNILYNAKRTGINVGSVCLYGQIFKFRKK